MLEQHEDNNASFGETEAPAEKKSGSSAKKIKALTDVPALRDYFARIGAEPRSLKTAVILETAGKYRRDVAAIRIEKDGAVKAPVDYAPTEEEAAAIKVGIAGFRWPEIQPLAALGTLPEEVRRADPKNVFEFRNDANEIVMLQVRTVSEAGERAYKPWTYWDDDEWRCCEPDGPLPLYNANRLREATTVFIHEGAKAARHMQRLVDGKTREDRDELKAHPWGAQLTGAVHVGWIGGALSPHRTDWSLLRKAGIERVFIVADNDEVGRKAVPKIAEALSCPTFMIQFGDEFPPSFDLADQFPEDRFQDGYWFGPAFAESVHPATWATNLLTNPEGKGRPITVLRDSFRGQWAYAEDAEVFVFRGNPRIRKSESALNAMLAPYSHTKDVARLILQDFGGRTVGLCYRPGEKGTSLTAGGSSAINIHRPSLIPPRAGDPKPFLEFMAYLFPNPKERIEVERWCATLIARPGVRMGYGLLLISEKQGAGKTTLGTGILAPLVGEENVSYPNEDDITGSFNGWIARKRLAVVNEVYQGASWKAYQTLKSVITDREVTVNEKHIRQYTLENWVHLFACSNSRRALKIESDDRRWFYPEVTENPWPAERFDALRKWLRGGGLGIIRAWAEGYGDYVPPGKHSPMTAMKKDMIEGSRSEAQAEAASIAEALADLKEPGDGPEENRAPRPAAVTTKAVRDEIKASVQGRVYDSDAELRKVMVECGLKVLPERIKILGRREYVLVNAELALELERIPEAGRPNFVRDRLVKLAEVLSL